MQKRMFRVLCSHVLIAAVLAIPVQLAQAGMISTDRIASDAKVQSDRQKIRAFMNRADAQAKLTALGIDPKLAKERVDALTDQEVVQIAGKIDSLPAGASMDKYDIMIILLIAILVAIAI